MLQKSFTLLRTSAEGAMQRGALYEKVKEKEEFNFTQNFPQRNSIFQNKQKHQEESLTEIGLKQAWISAIGKERYFQECFHKKAELKELRRQNCFFVVSFPKSWKDEEEGREIGLSKKNSSG